MVRVVLPNNKCIKLDLETWLILPYPRKWSFSESGHATVNISIHQLAFGHRTKSCIDHINNNPLDNQRHNLRQCSYSENNRNRKPVRTSWTGKAKASKYKGVVRRHSRNKWEARITIPNQVYKDGSNKIKYLGNYASEYEAAQAYNKAAKELFGEYAYLNAGVA